jgi:Sulfotransferase domain
MFVDGTPMLDTPYVWQRIYDSYPVNARDKLKFLVLLREPVSRDYSWYEHGVREDLFLGASYYDIRTMKEIVEYKDAELCDLCGGQYVWQLKELAKVFPRNQIFVLSTSELIRDTVLIMEKVRQFLGISEHKSLRRPLPHDDHISVFRERGGEELADCIVQHVPKLDCSLRDAYGAYYTKLNSKLYEWLNTTRNKAHPAEPLFPVPFEDYKQIPCSADARKEFNGLIYGGKEGLSVISVSNQTERSTRSNTAAADYPEGSIHMHILTGINISASDLDRALQHVYMHDRMKDIEVKEGSCYS